MFLLLGGLIQHCLLYFVNISETNATVDASRVVGVQRAPQETQRMPIESQKKSGLNVTVYLGFANSPFGPSTRLVNKKGKYVICLLHITTDLHLFSGEGRTIDTLNYKTFRTNTETTNKNKRKQFSEKYFEN